MGKSNFVGEKLDQVLKSRFLQMGNQLVVIYMPDEIMDFILYSADEVLWKEVQLPSQRQRYLNFTEDRDNGDEEIPSKYEEESSFHPTTFQP